MKMKQDNRILCVIIIIFSSILVCFGESPKKVAILNIIDKQNDVKYGIKLMLMGKMSSAITNTPGYEGYDRVDLGAVINEHEFQRTGMVNESQIKQLGIMTGADYILLAEVAKFDDNNIIITAKILNVETAKMEKSADVQTPIDIQTMEKNCNILAARLLSKRVSDNDLITKEEEIYPMVEIKPEFPGGEPALFRWLGNHINYPPMAAKNNIQGTVVVQFVVLKDGSIGEVKVVRSKDPDLAAEAIRVVKLMPTWRPGLQNGVPVNVWYALPISFKLQDK